MSLHLRSLVDLPWFENSTAKAEFCSAGNHNESSRARIGLAQLGDHTRLAIQKTQFSPVPARQRPCPLPGARGALQRGGGGWGEIPLGEFPSAVNLPKSPLLRQSHPKLPQMMVKMLVH
jgi:hypothetical protein